METENKRTQSDLLNLIIRALGTGIGKIELEDQKDFLTGSVGFKWKDQCWRVDRVLTVETNRNSIWCRNTETSLMERLLQLAETRS